MSNIDTTRAIEILKGNKNFTCVFCKGGSCYTSEKRGVAPLLDFIDSNTVLDGFCCADRVVGKGAALLYCVLKVDSVFASVISEKAIEVFERYSIKYSFNTKVPYIINRQKNGQCPIEKSVESVEDAALAVTAIKAALKNLLN